ncbi:MAG: hypothetical protein KDK40_02465, partial [Chlamydiia bacterium]|nr:hypothetical protein [Chlamydiia bacterium]
YATGEWLATLAPYCANLTTLKIGSQHYASQNLESLCASQHHLTTLNALHLFLPSLTPTDLDRLKTLGAKLIGLKIADPIIEDFIEDLKELWPRSPRLQKLSLPPLDRASLISLLKHCKSLKDFNGHFSASDAPMLIMQALPHAISLEISQIATLGPNSPSEQDRNFDGRWKQLTNLTLHNQSLSSETIFHLAERCPSLEFLDLSRCEAVEDAHVEIFINNCPQLKELIFNFCKKLTPALIPMINNPFLRISLLSVKYTNIEGCSLEQVKGCSLEQGLVPKGYENQVRSQKKVVHLACRTGELTTVFTSPSVTRRIRIDF